MHLKIIYLECHFCGALVFFVRIVGKCLGPVWLKGGCLNAFAHSSISVDRFCLVFWCSPVDLVLSR